MNKKVKAFLGLIALASVVGAVVSVYAMLAHYDAASSEFCSINETFDCDVVNKSQYSEILGVPVSLMGLVAYVFFFFASVAYRKQSHQGLLNIMTFGAVTGLLFSLYLTYIEAYVLYTWCLLCIISQISILAVTIGVFGIKWAEKTHKPTIQEIHE